MPATPGVSPIDVPPFAWSDTGGDQPLGSGCRALWLPRAPLDGGRTLYDLSASGRHGALGSAVTWSSGTFGAALAFPGTGGLAGQITPAKAYTTAGPFTIAARVYQTVNTGFCTIYADNAQGFWLNNGTPYYYPSGSGSAAVPLNTWADVAAVNDGIHIHFYIDGSPVGSVAAVDLPSGATLGIGGHSGSELFNGRIEYLLIYDRALAPGEVAALAADPLGILRPARRSIVRLGGAAGGTVYAESLALGATSGWSLGTALDAGGTLALAANSAFQDAGGFDAREALALAATAALAEGSTADGVGTLGLGAASALALAAAATLAGSLALAATTALAMAGTVGGPVGTGPAEFDAVPVATDGGWTEVVVVATDGDWTDVVDVKGT